MTAEAARTASTGGARWASSYRLIRDAGLAFSKIEGTDMKKINVWFFYALGCAIEPLKNLHHDMPWSDLYMTTWLGVLGLDKLDDEKFSEVPLKKCAPEARSLIEAAIPITSSKEPRTDLGLADMLKIRWAAEKFEHSLQIELRDADTYYVPPIGIFSTSALLSKAVEMFGDDAALLPAETANEFNEAGKCLAFALYTAAGFHLLRAVESAVRVYYDVLSNNAPPPPRASMGKYLDELLKLPGVDTDLEAVLRQIKKLHRDPVMHPEVVLKQKDTTSLIGIAHSAISKIIEIVESKKETSKP